ncbi:hypothetical protein [Streptococcus equi]|nr:hypothetical protein [Streptococcus equi]
MNKRIEKKRRTQMMLDRILRIVELMSRKQLTTTLLSWKSA